MRSVTYCGDHGAVSYSLLGPGSHACDIAGRPHRSNHVFFVLDFATGRFCQKCHDPDCADRRGPWMPLLAEVWRREPLAELIAARAAQLMQQQLEQQPQGGAGAAAEAAAAAAAGAAARSPRGDLGLMCF